MSSVQRNKTDTFNPKLYIPATTWIPDHASLPIEEALTRFNSRLLRDINSFSTLPRTPNLRHSDITQLEYLREESNLMVVHTDKNLGPALIDRATCITRALDDHLLNSKNYCRLDTETANTLFTQSFAKILRLTLGAHSNFRPRSSNHIYFTRAYCYDDAHIDIDPGLWPIPPQMHMPRFYIMPKVHKNPWATRPVVSQSGSIFEPLSKWLDAELQKVITLCPAYLKDSWDLLKAIRAMHLPANAYFITADAVSMYSNIDTDHGLATISNWLQLHKADLPKGFDSRTVLEGLDLIMRFNIFEFGDTHWIQQTGTAMGTSVACVYATIYYSYHEETRLLRNPINEFGIYFYRRYIDDALAVMYDPATNYQPFAAAMNSFGDNGRRLEWEVEEPSKTVNFLDLTLAITPTGAIVSKTYQKAMNLYLYLPPTSAHPPHVFMSQVYGTLQRYWIQNSDLADFKNIATSFFRRLVARGHDPITLRTWFITAAQRLDLPVLAGIPLRLDAATPDPLILHVHHHPDMLPGRNIQKCFRDTCLAAFTSDDSAHGVRKLAFSTLVIARKRAPNIRDLACRTKLRQNQSKPEQLVSQRILLSQRKSAEQKR